MVSVNTVEKMKLHSSLTVTKSVNGSLLKERCNKQTSMDILFELRNAFYNHKCSQCPILHHIIRTAVSVSFNKQKLLVHPMPLML